MGNPTLSSLPGLEQRVCGAGVVVLFWCWLLTARKGSQDKEQFQAWASLRNAHWQVQSTSTIGEWAAFRTGGDRNPPRIVSMEMHCGASALAGSG